MPTYEFLCHACKGEFEDFLSITAPIPTDCPHCKINGQVQRLISGGSGKGMVELTGQDLKDHCVAEGRKLREQATKSEKVMATLVGETKYHQNETVRQRTASELGKIRRRG